jgi:hypothetical protein
MKAFEIHTFRGGNWKIDSVFDDKELALFEARRMDESSRYSGVRVVEENFNESSNETVTRTLFKGGRAEKQASVRQQEVKNEAKKTARRKGAKGRTGKGKRPIRKKKKSGIVMPLLILSAIVIIGLAALFGLQHVTIFR